MHEQKNKIKGYLTGSKCMVKISGMSFNKRCEIFPLSNSNNDFINLWMKQKIKVNLQKKKIERL